MKRRHIIWKGLQTLSLEYCTITSGSKQITIQSVVLGLGESVPFSLRYLVNLTADWRVLSAEINIALAGKEETVRLRHDEYDSWFQNDMEKKEFKGCQVLDISLTPFTNSLVICSRSFVTGEPQKIKTVYIDILEQKITAKEQAYTSFADSTFQFENTDDDFKVVIEVVPPGLVSFYPGLFEMVFNKEF